MSKTGLLSLTIRQAAEEHSVLCAKPNRSAWVRNAIDAKLQREATRPGKPRTPLGRKLLAARAEYQATGGRPLSLDEVRLEVARRRGECDDFVTAEKPGKPLHKARGLKVSFLPAV
jgi:hypothetical protein